MSEEHQHNTKRELIQRISDVTHIRADVVQEVMEGLVDVAIEELCSNDGHFRIAELMSVGPEQVKAYENKLGYVPAHKRLRIRLSQLPKIMYKIQQDHFAHAPGTITAENWREVFDHYRDDEHGGYKYVLRDARPLGSVTSEHEEAHAGDPAPRDATPTPHRAPQEEQQRPKHTPPTAPRTSRKTSVPQRVPTQRPDRPTPSRQRPNRLPDQEPDTPASQHLPERTETPPGVPRRPKTGQSAIPKPKRHSTPHNPFLEDDETE